MHWPLQQAELELLHPYAISNEAAAEKIVCSCLSGYLGLYCLFQEA
ncbi:hypothetical protein EVA_12941 [gut metagenome]|uniref:Uncharacterized protein n=1 Tax=gut metagenome TaxID=749906 RepID=J9FVC3_9ZZZZ